MKVKVGKLEVDVMDALCPFRECFHLHQWMGTYTQGRGYSYAPRSQWFHHCQRRADHRCPVEIPEPDPERGRCCHAPQRQRCTTCGAWLTGYPLEVARNHPLPELYPSRWRSRSTASSGSCPGGLRNHEAERCPTP